MKKVNLNINVLRSVALIYMIMYHIFAVTNLRFNNRFINDFISFGGVVGVSLFFIISGFSVYKLIENKKEKYDKYIINRLKKIGPHYYGSLLVCLLFTPSIIYFGGKKSLCNNFSYIFCP